VRIPRLEVRIDWHGPTEAKGASYRQKSAC
jgi:hypothetical protein